MIRGPTGHRLAPSFDHASCLGFLLSDDQRRMHLTTSDTNQTVAAYARRAASKFASRPTLLRLTIDALALASIPAQRLWMAAVEATSELSEITDRVPEDRMSATAKQFAAALYRESHQVLSHAIRTMEP
ncbi:MAG TPA: hypothetical protein VM142_00215 [Acidimicrobiales bacterium]|nr:hypothetical protein [Acidimicrobiales bacterium]